MDSDKTIINLENINFWNSLQNLNIENNENICPKCNEIMSEKINVRDIGDLYTHCKKKFIKCCSCKKIEEFNYVGYCNGLFLHICYYCKDYYETFYRNVKKYVNNKVKYTDKIIEKFPIHLCENKYINFNNEIEECLCKYKYSDQYDKFHCISEIEKFVLFVKNEKIDYDYDEEIIDNDKLSMVINTMEKYLR